MNAGMTSRGLAPDLRQGRCILITGGGAWERLAPNADLTELHERNNPLGRPGSSAELAQLVAYLVSDKAAYIQGDCVTIDGGRWLKGAGTFGFLDALTPREWDSMRPAKRAR